MQFLILILVLSFRLPTSACLNREKLLWKQRVAWGTEYNLLIAAMNNIKSGWIQSWASNPVLCVSEGQRISVRNCNVTDPLTMGSKYHFLSIDHGTKNVHSGKTDTCIYQKHISTYEQRTSSWYWHQLWKSILLTASFIDTLTPHTHTHTPLHTHTPHL